MGVKFLRNQAQKLRMNAHEERKLAEHKERTVDSLTKEGADTKAEVVEHDATSLARSASALELEALALERQAEAKEKEAEQLDAQEKQLRQNFERELKVIEDKRRELLD
jgi:hypothetical protein